MKMCSRCGCLLPEDLFNWKIKDKIRSSHCKNCSREYVKEHYRKNKQYYLNKAKINNRLRKNKMYQYIGNYLKNHPCIDCGEIDICVLEFDHKDKNLKIDHVSKIVSNIRSFELLKKEIEKCDVRCANCHRRKTEKENKSWKTKFK